MRRTHCTYSNLDGTVKHKIRRSSEADLGKFGARVLEAHFELVSALDLHAHRRGETMDASRDKRRSGHPRAARKGLALDSAFERSHANGVWPQHLDKVDVGALRGEM